MRDLKNLKAERPYWQKLLVRTLVVLVGVLALGFLNWCASYPH